MGGCLNSHARDSRSAKGVMANVIPVTRLDSETFCEGSRVRCMDKAL